MAKYTIETNGSTADSIDGNLGVVIEVYGRRIWVQTPLSLTPYTEPDTESIRKEAYAEGYKEGMQLSIDDAKLKEAYKKGLSDAWEAVRKVIHMPEADLLNIFDECYSAVCTSVQVFLKYDASECIEKIRQYEQGKEEIKVGDEVKSIERGWTAVVVRISNDDSLILMDSNGAIADAYNKTMFVKTGRHFSEIAEVLTKMRGK